MLGQTVRDTLGEVVENDSLASYWLEQIEYALRSSAAVEWQNRCAKVRRIYRDDQSTTALRRRKYNILWANMETMKASVYTQAPKAVVQRRWSDNDPIGRQAVEILERAINFMFEINDVDSRLKQVRDDYLLYGRGVARVFYDPVFETVEDNEQTSGLDIEAMEGPDADVREQAVDGSVVVDGEGALKFENVKVRFVQRDDFVHQISRVWDEVDWVAFRGYLDRQGLIDRFGEKIGKQIPLEQSPDTDRFEEDKAETSKGKAEIWEVWDKVSREVLWVSKGYPDVLESGAPYLELDGFYPCPRPVYGTLTNESLFPIPDYVFYQDQAEEINRLTARIAALTDSLKLVGFYSGGPQGEGSPEIEKAVKPGFENRMIAVKSWSAFASGQGKDQAPIVWLPIEQVSNILTACVELRKQLIDDVNQIYGISDILRGDGDKEETATAQSIKAQYGSTRIRGRQQDVARFARDITRMTGEIIAKIFQAETLEKISNIKLPKQSDVVMQAIIESVMKGRLPPTSMLSPHLPSGTMMGLPPPKPNGELAPPPMMGTGQPPPNMMAQQQPQPGAPPQQQPPQQPPPQQDPQQQSVPSQPPKPQVTEEAVMELLRDDVLRRFRIDIEADSTITGDESQEKADRNEFIMSITKFMETWGPMIEQQPMLAPLASAFLMFGVRAYRVGRELEEQIEETSDKMSAMFGNLPPGAGKNDGKAQAEMIKLQGTQAKSQAEVQKAGMDAQQSQVKGQTAMEAALMKAKTEQAAAMAKMQQIQAKTHADMIKAQADLQKVEMEMAHDRMLHAQTQAQMSLQSEQANTEHQHATEQAAMQSDRANTEHRHAAEQESIAHRHTTEQAKMSHKQSMEAVKAKPKGTHNA